MDLPQWKSHKAVGAFRIEAVDTQGLGLGAHLNGDGISVVVDSAYVRKHEPKAGGYYVRYEDGYESWSPAEAFEAGYTLLHPHDDPSSSRVPDFTHTAFGGVLAAPDKRALSLDYAAKLAVAADLRNEKQTLAFAEKIRKYLEGEDPK